MATEKKNDKERSVEERLTALYKLQTCLSEIDRIKSVRGELPLEVKDLEDDIIRLKTRIQNYQDDINKQNDLITNKEGDIEARKLKIARYDEQIDNVRNNREYAFLEKEKEFESLEIELAEKNIRDAQAKIADKKVEIERTKDELIDREHNLGDKKEELTSIISETKQEEEKLLIQAKELETKIDDYTLNAFKRIRKNARNGLGIVSVQRSACGGCFNRIPPQRQLEIKMHKKVIVCEYCGRILIDGVLAGIEETPTEQPTTKRRARRAAKAKAKE